MFKESQNCRIPHINIDRLRDELHQVGFARGWSQEDDRGAGWCD